MHEVRKNLNNGEKIVLNAIVHFLDKNKIPPTIRELCKLTGYKSTCTVQDKLKSLESKGYIETTARGKRTIKIKEPAPVQPELYDLLCEIERKYHTYYDEWIKKCNQAETEAEFQKIHDSVIRRFEFYVQKFADYDIVKVVRCKNCEHYKDEWCEILRAESPIADGFCCYGKRRCSNDG